MTDHSNNRHAVLGTAEMAEADRRTIAGGTSGAALMEHAGAAVVRAMRTRWSMRPVLVLCGPGNNGGDGFVIARLLADAGWPVRLALLGPCTALKGDAARHAGVWQGDVLPMAPGLIAGAALIVDAIFGAGLSRPPEGVALATLAAAAESGLPIVAVDIPSGVFGDTGADAGAAQACLTVTFCRPKPGHLLLPGRALCGALVVADIGIPAAVIEAIAPTVFENHPDLWRHAMPVRSLAGHKYTNGHALLWGGPVLTGAARMAARAAARAGAGLVTLAVPPASWPIYATALTSIMAVPIDSPAALDALLEDPRLTGLLIGPGAGSDGWMRSRVLQMLARGTPIVLDADVFTAFRSTPAAVLGAIRGACVMTPHEGEFARIFRCTGSKLARARQAATESSAVMVLKGADTVIASPNGRAIINTNAPPTLATAGAGDVLGGIILGLLTQGMPAFEAAAAGVWLHGACAEAFGPGLIAEDLPDLLPQILRGLDATPA